ncbi:MAG: ABC transporter substrate-binding protein [Hyphomicrobiales bacterium]|nr:ABC transporter substrate-binding protein [Hyphomicrobiales bacterium]
MRGLLLTSLATIAALATGAVALEAQPGSLIETPSLEKQVAAGALPPVGQRIPLEPQIVDLEAENKQPGRHGGELRMLMGKAKDTRMVTVYGYARLVVFTPDFKLKPDILKHVEVEEGRVFTLHLRPGHRWSDGHPFTAEDFRYYWEDMVKVKKLSRKGVPRQMRVGKEAPTFTLIDEHTVRYAWSKPNHAFLPWLAGARPPAIYRPAHYLKQFHIKHGDKDKIAKLVKTEGRRNWAELHFSRDRPYRADNPERPTLEPWVNVTPPPSERFVFKRNPYYHRIDKNGRQLPYVDRVVVNLGSVSMVPARTGSGEANLQARYIRFVNYTFLKKSEKRNNFSVKLWRTLKSSHKALYPNLNAKDEAWRTLLNDVRFRRALSLAVNRHEINQVIYYGLAKASNNTVFEDSPLFRPEYRTAWAQFDPKQANALLDEIGLTERDDDGTRLLPDGRPMEIIVDTAGESTEEADILELITDSWKQVGIKLFTRPSQRQVFRNRVYSGKAIMAMWAGLGNGLSNASMSPGAFAPTFKAQYNWPKWGTHTQTMGKKGQAPTLAAAQRLVALYRDWERATTEAEQTRIWHEILRINAEQVFTIGIVNATLHPIVASTDLVNVPEKGFYNWDPGAYFGIYKPDTFWFRTTQKSAAR